MPSKKTKNKKPRHILLILLLIVTAIFFLYREFGKEEHKPRKSRKHIQYEEGREILPRVAIVIDDLGPSKTAAIEVLNISPSLTLSIFPQETHTKWIAEEGHRRGHDIIGHIPMESKEPHRLGKGGLYTWMTNDEIRKTLKEDLGSIPHLKGVSNHMGSAFTEDERTMSIIMSVLKEHRLFFLDSLTSPDSAGLKLAKKHGIKVLKRDIFLDDKDTPDYIEAQWKRLVAPAKKQGYAIVLAHPRKNTIEFLNNILLKEEVVVVPLSELAASP